MATASKPKGYKPFTVKDSNIYPMPGSAGQALHLATITHGLKEYVVFVYITGPAQGNTYIEEVVVTSVDFSSDVFAHCKFIEDDNLAYDLAKFVEEKQLINQRKIAETLLDRGKFSWIMGQSGLSN